MASQTLSLTEVAPGESLIISGSLAAWETGGLGRYSITDTRTAVERGSQVEKMALRIFLGSRERNTWAGIVIERDLVIFPNNTESLINLHQYISRSFKINKLRTYPFASPQPVVALYTAQILSNTS
jgi:hypothetical protein